MRTGASVLPPRPFLGSIVLRSVLAWTFLRAAASGAGAAEGVAYPAAFTGHPVSALWVAAVVIVAVRVEMWRQGELIFLANLGHSFTGVAGIVTGCCLGLEVAVRLLLG